MTTADRALPYLLAYCSRGSNYGDEGGGCENTRRRRHPEGTAVPRTEKPSHRLHVNVPTNRRIASLQVRSFRVAILR
jgi:hypothetical protein